MLQVENLHVTVDAVPILKGISLTVRPGEVHAIMGPNGSGKSTLSKVIAGHPAYEVISGTVSYTINGESINVFELTPDERAYRGIFMAFQYPVEIPGVSNAIFLRTALNQIRKFRGEDPLDPMDFDTLVQSKLAKIRMDASFLDRSVNVDFSGGEKKRNEILQMAVLEPRVAFLDETDSGLDIDSLKIVADGVNSLRSDRNAVVLITHYQRILNYIVPDFVHVLHDGKIIRSGDKGLAVDVESHGYDWLLPS